MLRDTEWQILLETAPKPWLLDTVFSSSQDGLKILVQIFLSETQISGSYLQRFLSQKVENVYRDIHFNKVSQLLVFWK